MANKLLKPIWLHILLCINITCLAQSELQQTVRFIITDKFSKSPIENVNVICLEKNNYNGVTNSSGELEMLLPIGRYNFAYSIIGYKTVSSADIIVNSGKQVILNIELEQKATNTKMVVIKGKKAKEKALNEMSIISARQFTVNETNRYAGTLGDPSRMAQNFAGVVSNGDKRNDIIIRGNSPLGLSWRLEGVEIPNPNHFSGVGTTGGSISILNNNNLSNSDFITGAFAPEYGNATAGVFDLKLKNGNNKTHEHMFQIGFNGAEIGSEGPINKQTNSSYIINARYSTLGLFSKLGINLGTTSTPKYKDLTFKLHFPTKKMGTIDVWGIAGNNDAISYSKDYDTTGTKLNPRPKGFDTYFYNWMLATGINHVYKLNNKTLSTLALTFTNVGNRTKIDSLYNNDQQKAIWLNRYFNENNFKLTYKLGYKWNANNQTHTGIYIQKSAININDSLLLTSYNRYISLLAFNGNTNLNRAYVQHILKPSNNINIVGGLHFMHLNLNKNWSIEPRLAMQYNISNKLSAQIGTGIHYQTQALTTYFFNRTGTGNFVDSLTNKQLDFTKSKHLVIGTNYNFTANFHVKVEAYAQWLSQIPIENNSTSTYSAINEGTFYYNTTRPFMVNNGLGKNKGIELTVEQFFNKGFYCLLTSSIYKSTYKAGDNIWRSTAFDGRYSISALAGYEFKIKNKNTFNINAKIALLGGRPYSPVDTVASMAIGEIRFTDTDAFSLRFPNYFRPDIKFGYRLNNKRYSQEISINIDNIINRQNIQTLEYDKIRNKVGYSYQVGLFPVVQYKIEF